jgi:DNA-binding NarL/FixJ family response regulator
MEMIGEATNGAEALAAYGRCLPDVTLMDLQMPGCNGIEATAAIRAKWPQAKIVVLTVYSGDIQPTQALKAGASGFLLKDALRKELIGTIRDVHAGRKKLSAEIASRLAENMAADGLTSREVEVLHSVAAGYSNKRVGEELAISDDTVKGHMRSIMSKLRANDRTHAVLIAIKRGYFVSEV